MHMAGNVMLFLITIVCITSTLAKHVENFQPYNETELAFYNKTECDCGPHYESCMFNGFQKSCVCEHGYSDRNGTCTECDCGYNARSCVFDLNGVKHCVCDNEHTEYNGTCVECSCGKHTKSCEIEHHHGNKRCECENGYILRQGECVESCAWSGCPENQICRPNEEGKYICQCKPHFGGKDCKTNLLCEKLEPMCRDMGAECIVENSQAICRCPWGQTVGIPSGICEDLCNPQTCFHGRCEFLTNSKVERNYRCICEAGYTGLRCETKIVDNSGELIRFAILVSINIILFILISAMFCFLCANRNKQMK